MSKKWRYEVWFKTEPFYMASVSKKTLLMKIRQNPSDIKRYRKIENPPDPADYAHG